MEGLAPPLACLLEVRLGLENGASVNRALVDYLGEAQGDFADELRQWRILYEQGVSTEGFIARQQSSYRRALFSLFERGLRGEPILSGLNDLEKEMVEACRDQLELHLRRLPILGLIPLMLFQAPALLLLLFGPILTDLLGRLAE